MPLPIQFLVFLLIGWVSRQQEEVIEYLKAENLALRKSISETSWILARSEKDRYVKCPA
jgi:hypothetical protein